MNIKKIKLLEYEHKMIKLTWRLSGVGNLASNPTYSFSDVLEKWNSFAMS